MIRKKISMAAWLLVWFCWGMGIGQVAAQYKTDFLLTGLQNEQLKTSVEQSLTALLTEFNTAQAAGRSLQWDAPALQGKLSEQAIASLRALWANSPFRCTETEVIEKCLQTPSGYQVRNIPLIMMPLDKENYQDDLYQELVVNLDRNGTISEVYFSIGMHLYSKVIRSNITVTDLRRRQVILDCVENFRTAYNRILSLPLFRKGRYYSGVQYEQENVREYPYDELARRTIGFVRNNKSPVRNTHIGLEGKFDYELHGKEGREYLRETDQGTVRNNDSTVVRAVDGNDLRSTLNIDYQEIADFALREQIEPEAAIEGACLVLMEVKTGAIRAMVNLLREGEEHTGPFSEIQNLAIGRKNEPGSVFKTVTLTALLNDGYIRSLEETLPATDGHVDGTAITDKHIPDYARDHNTDKISIIDGFKISSNYVFAKLAVDNYARNRRGDRTEQFLSNLYTYKLGEAFDFDLDGMQTPTIPSPETRYWTDTDLGSIAYGYSTSMTPMHILTFYNALANKGRMMKPYLVEDIESEGQVIRRRGPAVLNAAICSRAVADTVTRALKAVTEEGTARRLRGARCTVAGMTGTSFGNYEKGQYAERGIRMYQGTFVGFFPADDPKYSIICTVYSKPTSRSFQGGGIPASAVRTVIDRLYNLDLDLSADGK